MEKIPMNEEVEFIEVEDDLIDDVELDGEDEEWLVADKVLDD